MTTTTENGLTIVRHTGPDVMTSVYRGTVHLGLALPTLRLSDYAITGWTVNGAEFATEQAAIDYLNRARGVA